MKKQKLTAYLSGLYMLSLQFSAALEAAISSKNLKKGQVLSHTAAIPGIWFIESGLAKGVYYDQNGKEHITRFWKQGEIMLLAKGVQPPAFTAEHIVLLEDSRLATLTSASLIFLYHTFPEASKLSAKMLLTDRNLGELRSYLCSLGGREAYRIFKQHFPSHRLLLQDIASYLEISPGRLSEIRRKST
ncbi:Crp/Fnr family transcriptional regulator [Dyadobacter subterraneus]|uniref:Crp/Fnr family transcriptional regulator n=1 Tax=Dyadobacter subterraneus TaxID=2773304 RepID=A0ABR9WCM9_9BACT|nr:Crp/Fnr family transcriptional regulator [Dyadobacter subterraneus]MBE9462126.1 Crp/Fnr family transcriptional regulator [Dyadobacter subterraneus]